MPTQKIFAFGCEDASFITPGATPIYTDIKGVQEAEFSMEVDKTEVKGDDDLMTVWLHSQKATVTLKHGVIDLDVFETVTGNQVTNETGPPQEDSILLGTDTEMEPPEFMLRLKLKAKSVDDGSKKEFYVYIYRVVGSIKLEGIKQGEGAVVTIEGDCFRSTKDELNENLAEPARAKLVVLDAV